MATTAKRSTRKTTTKAAAKGKAAAKKGPAQGEVRLHQIVTGLAAKGEATAKMLDIPSVYFTAAVKSGHIVFARAIKTGGRGRPAFAYKLTAKGKTLAKSVAKKG